MRFTGKQFAAMPVDTRLRKGIPTDKYFAAMVRTKKGWDNAWGLGWIDPVPGAEIDWDEIVYPNLEQVLEETK